MGNSIRWTSDQLEEYRKRAESQGAVKTHKIGREGEAREANKRGGRVSKYGNIKAEADGQIFASKRERGRWMDLRVEERAGEIKNLQRQVAYPITVNGFKVCDYFADFVYERAGAIVVEDSKGYRTEVFKLKTKLMFAVHGVEVLET